MKRASPHRPFPHLLFNICNPTFAVFAGCSLFICRLPLLQLTHLQFTSFAVQTFAVSQKLLRTFAVAHLQFRTHAGDYFCSCTFAVDLICRSHIQKHTFAIWFELPTLAVPHLQSNKLDEFLDLAALENANFVRQILPACFRNEWCQILSWKYMEVFFLDIFRHISDIFRPYSISSWQN